MNIIIYKLFMHNNYENVKPSFEKNTIFFLKDLSSYTLLLLLLLLVLLLLLLLLSALL